MALWLFKVYYTDHYTKTQKKEMWTCKLVHGNMDSWCHMYIACISWWELALGVCIFNRFCLQQPARTKNKKGVCFLWKGCKPIAENWGTKFVHVADVCCVSGKVWTVSSSCSFWAEDEPHVLSPGQRTRSRTRSGSQGNLMYPKDVFRNMTRRSNDVFQSLSQKNGVAFAFGSLTYHWNVSILFGEHS